MNGQVQVVRHENGEDKPVASLGVGEYFGEVSLLQGVRHTASVRALDTTDLLVMSGPDLKALAASSAEFAESLNNAMQRWLSDSHLGQSKADEAPEP